MPNTCVLTGDKIVSDDDRYLHKCWVHSVTVHRSMPCLALTLWRVMFTVLVSWCWSFLLGASLWTGTAICLFAKVKLEYSSKLSSEIKLPYSVQGRVSRVKGIYVWLVKFIRVCVVFDSWSTTLCWISSGKLATWNLLTRELCIMSCHHTPGELAKTWV